MAYLTGWQAIVKALCLEGIQFVYGLPSNPKDLYDALYDEDSIKAIQVRHEAAGGFMAMAHALSTGEPAVCYASQGPGIANLTPAALESLATCAPVIMLGAGVDGHIYGKGAFQESDQIGLMSPLTKWAVRVPYAEKIPWVIRRAFFLATNGQPGPVYIEIPPEVGRNQADIPDYVPAVRRLKTAGDCNQIKKAIELITRSKQPVIVAGGGARRSQVHDELKALADLLGMPVMTTPSGRGSIEEDHPLSFGQVGLYRNNLGIKTFAAADLLITVGSRNEEFQTGAWKLFPKGAKFIQVDIEPFEIGRNWLPDVPIWGDAKMVLSSILDGIKDFAAPAWEERKKKYSEEKKAYEAQVTEECEKCSHIPIKSKRVVYEINQVFGRNTIMVHENGSQDLWSYYNPYYRVLDRDGDIAPGEQTCMGAGVIGAVGAKLAHPDKKVVCVTGDGAFQMYNQDVPTAVQYNAPVTWVILNNFSLGWPKVGQKELGGRYIATDFAVQPDFVQMAHAYSCYGERVEKPEDIRGALKRALKANESGKSAILDFIIDPEDLAEGFKLYRKL
ncbi:MAG: acetolactate synthase large subunit [Candidatus Atribacteria bacterium]|nr:acetolactate synthase large subunit [Candidatus Atribacteria bacterium]